MNEERDEYLASWIRRTVKIKCHSYPELMEDIRETLLLLWEFAEANIELEESTGEHVLTLKTYFFPMKFHNNLMEVILSVMKLSRIKDPVYEYIDEKRPKSWKFEYIKNIQDMEDNKNG